MKVNKVFLTVLVMALSGLAMPPVHADMTVKKSMSGPLKYFEPHTFNFGSYFYQYHPGPHWDLVNTKKLHLSPTQIKAEEHLIKGMKQDTMRGIRDLKVSYRRYKNDARQKDPKISTLIRDVKAVGHAQAYLAYEMIPYHLRGYRLLNNTQKVIYKRLAHENWARIMDMKQMGKH